jgi:hypothetical protein
MTYLLLVVALSLSAVAAWYAIAGLMAIFAAAAIPIAVMGGLLETSKLVIASWLYRNWKEIPKLMRAYFTFSLVVLMMLTSMGIFGFLSKAHLDQAIPTGDVAAKLALIDEKIKTEKENINASRKELSQLDAQVDQTISRTTDDKGAERAIAIRRGQQKDRARILNDIGTAQARVAKLNEERAPIASEVRKVEAEVGPIKYIAALIYEENASEEILEKAVRIVTLMIVIVFDPLAVLMLIAANWSLKNNRKPDWTNFFKKRNEVDLEELPDVKEIKIEDDITIGDKPDAWVADVGEKPTEEELNDINLDIEEPKNEWSPELYQRVRHKTETTKTRSFLNKIQKTLSGEKTIEKEVEELQKEKPNKPVEYDSAGRRITP